MNRKKRHYKKRAVVVSRIVCHYYKCDKLGRNYANPYCPVHLNIVNKLEHIIRNPNKKRVCLYPDCGTILTALNNGYFCYVHFRKVTFEKDGHNADKVGDEMLDVSGGQWDKMMRKVVLQEKET